MHEEPAIKKERESRDDGRYIIFFSFEDEGEGETPNGDDEG